MSLDFFANFIPLAIGLLVVSSLILIVGLIFKKPTQEQLKINFDKRGPLLSAAEQNFYQHLLEAVPPEVLIFSKVRIADVLKVAATPNRSMWQIAFNKISAKHFDFVLCDKNTFDVLAVVELDDKSHNRKKTQKRDEFVDEACKTAKLAMVRVKASNRYDIPGLQISILEYLEPVNVK